MSLTDPSRQPECPALGALHDYWEIRRAGRPFPSRTDIDPLDMKFALGNVVLVDVLHQPLQFRFRLVGSNLVQRLGFEMTGKTLDEYPEPEFRALIDRTYRSVIERREPVSIARDRVIDGRTYRYQAFIAPLSTDGILIDMLLVGTFFDDPR